jgi:hypothetical protein
MLWSIKMTLIEEVKKICEILAPAGWKDLLLKHGLDITAADLKKELDKELPAIDRTIPGFEDFALEGIRGIEPGNPSRSLLFHALASPNVLESGNESKSELTLFPNHAQIEIVENYVYGSMPPSILDLRKRAGKGLLAIVVFAHEYRPAPETVHQKHADVCFSRTGVSRVGSSTLLYDNRLRGFLPFDDKDIHSIRVLPAKYSAYVAVQMKGDFNKFGPMRSTDIDKENDFWVPIHKLFSGSECIRGRNINVSISAHHINEKLRRIHIELIRKGNNTGWKEPDISKPPFIFSDGIAELSNDPNLGSGLVVPVPHSPLIEPAKYKGKDLSFIVPKNSPNLSSSLYIPNASSSDGKVGRHASEYVHVRTRILNGNQDDLNEQPDVVGIVVSGGYNALHYIDFTGDGWVEAICPELSIDFPRPIPAYSLVTAPDFFPNADQRELMDWWEKSIPSSLKDILWEVEPLTLSDQRFPPNLQLKGANFRQEDVTVTAIVSLSSEGTTGQTILNEPRTSRHAYLPDASAGVFAPGWDISQDITPTGIQFLAAYGLGSPFPEDSKLCAALSTFWPAVAPDATRTFQPNNEWPTVSPLTDEEIGITGNLPWDGETGPHFVDNGKSVEYMEFDHVDYTLNALKKQFSLSLTGKIDIKEYESRVLSMARVYQALNSIDAEQKASWSLVSFNTISKDNKDLKSAENQTGTELDLPIYKFELYKHGTETLDPNNPRKVKVAVLGDKVTLFTSPIQILKKIGNGPWVNSDV